MAAAFADLYTQNRRYGRCIADARAPRWLRKGGGGTVRVWGSGGGVACMIW